MELLAERSCDVLFLVLNYDDLFEKALFKYDTKLYFFRQLEDYVRPGRQANLIKMHGSVNWYRPIGKSTTISWLEAVKVPHLRSRPADPEIIVYHNVGEIKDYPHQGTWLYPILTAPIAVKSATEIACPGSHTVFAEEFLSACTMFLVVGTSGSDADLFDILERSTGGVQATKVHFVGKGSQTQKSLDRFQNGMGVFPSAAVTVFTDGFKHYVNNHLRDFSE
jgi:hypothetical protein